MLTEVDRDLFVLDREITLPGGTPFCVRMTVIRLSGRALVLISPVRLEDDDVRVLQTLGTVTYLIAPNNFHHLFLSKAATYFPNARVYGAPGLAKKRPEVQFAGFFHTDSLEGLSPELEHQFIEGAPGVSETVFFHAPTHTLVVTDLLFHLGSAQNWKLRLLMRIMAGDFSKPVQSRAWRWLFTQNPKAVGEAVRRMLQWDIRRVIMAHGDIIGTDAREHLEQALSWMKQLK